MLPERFQARELGLIVCMATELPDPYLDQLIDKSRQPHILEFEGHEDVGTKLEPGRFYDREAYRDWAATKERILYMMINGEAKPVIEGVPDIGGVIWFGKRDNAMAPGRDLTFAIRNYAADEKRGYQQYQGTGLGLPFMQAAHTDLRKYHPGEQLWLDLVDGNAAAETLYGRAGYEVEARFLDPDHGDQSRVVMVNDTVLMSEQLSEQTVQV